MDWSELLKIGLYRGLLLALPRLFCLFSLPMGRRGRPSAPSNNYVTLLHALVSSYTQFILLKSKKDWLLSSDLLAWGSVENMGKGSNPKPGIPLVVGSLHTCGRIWFDFNYLSFIM